MIKYVKVYYKVYTLLSIEKVLYRTLITNNVILFLSQKENRTKKQNNVVSMYCENYYQDR